MFEVGFSELLLICVIALLVLGPQKLPKLAQQVGRWMGRARTMARQFRDQLEEETLLEETRASQPANNSTTTTTPANNLSPDAALPDTLPADAAPAASAPTGTAATGVPPDDDFAHHNNADSDPADIGVLHGHDPRADETKPG